MENKIDLESYLMSGNQDINITDLYKKINDRIFILSIAQKIEYLDSFEVTASTPPWMISTLKSSSFLFFRFSKLKIVTIVTFFD
jgi:hypothetical protein